MAHLENHRRSAIWTSRMRRCGRRWPASGNAADSWKRSEN